MLPVPVLPIVRLPLQFSSHGTLPPPRVHREEGTLVDIEGYY